MVCSAANDRARCLCLRRSLPGLSSSTYYRSTIHSLIQLHLFTVLIIIFIDPSLRPLSIRACYRPGVQSLFSRRSLKLKPADSFNFLPSNLSLRRALVHLPSSQPPLSLPFRFNIAFHFSSRSFLPARNGFSFACFCRSLACVVKHFLPALHPLAATASQSSGSFPLPLPLSSFTWNLDIHSLAPG